MTSGDGGRRHDRLADVLLAVLFLFTALAVVGYGVFGTDPGRLPASPLALAVYRVAYPAFAQIHVLLAAAVLFTALSMRARARWIPALGVTAVLAALAELAGTTWGVPFGEYRYTGLLGPKIAGRVPLLIPLSWFLVAVPAYGIAHHVIGGGSDGRWARLGVGTGLLLVWDLALDPAMSHLTPYWIWGQTGLYYGMPALNLFGWLVTGLVLMAALDALGAGAWTRRVPFRWHAAYYGVILLMPLGMCVAGGLVGVVPAVGAGLVGPAWVARRAERVS